MHAPLYIFHKVYIYYIKNNMTENSLTLSFDFFDVIFRQYFQNLTTRCVERSVAVIWLMHCLQHNTTSH